MQQRPGGDTAAAIVSQTKTGKGRYFEVALQSAAAKVIVKIPVIQCEDGDSQPALNILQIYAADLKGLIADDLSGAVAHDLIHQLAFVIHFCHKVGAGGNVCNGNSEMIRDAHDAHQVIVF